MARTLINSASPSRGGTGNCDTVNGNVVNNDGKRRWIVHTTTADPTFSISFAQTVDGVLPAAQTYNLGANKWVLVGPFDQTAYGTQVAFNAGQATTTVLPID